MEKSREYIVTVQKQVTVPVVLKIKLTEKQMMDMAGDTGMFNLKPEDIADYIGDRAIEIVKVREQMDGWNGASYQERDAEEAKLGRQSLNEYSAGPDLSTSLSVAMVQDASTGWPVGRFDKKGGK